jgi:hypothetical protein
MGRATTMDSLDQSILKQWLQQESQGAINYPPVAEPLADWILNPNRPILETLANQVWHSR